MSEVPNGRCGYTSPPNHEVGVDPSHQSCCWRPTLDDTNRCVWHADPNDTNEKTSANLQEVRPDPEVRARTLPLYELLDGAELAGFEIKDSISLSGVALRNADLTGADLTGGDLRGAHF